MCEHIISANAMLVLLMGNNLGTFYDNLSKKNPLRKHITFNTKHIIHDTALP